MVDFDLESIGITSPGEGKRIIQEKGLEWNKDPSLQIKKHITKEDSMRKIQRFLILVVVLFSFCSKPISNKKPNIILIIPDALRAKQLPSYGYNQIKTEAIENLAKRGVIFKNCFVNTASTLFSFSNLFSGLRFPSLGLINGEKTLAQYLQENGYYTVGFVSSQVLWTSEYIEKGIDREFSRGFKEYIQDVSLKKPPYYRKNEDTTADIINWLNEHKDINSPFFLFAHYMDPHTPYNPSYDGEIEKIDNELSKIIKKLKELSLYDDSMFIFTSDHGESSGEHNSPPQGHGFFLYTEEIQIPLIIKFPNNKYIKAVDQVARNIDIMPTILDYIGIKTSKNELDGKSLLPTIKRNKNLDLISYHFTGTNRLCPEGSEGIMFRNKKILYHYIQGIYSDRYREFYNITLDPDEKNNLYNNYEYKKIIKNAKKILLNIKQKKQLITHKKSSTQKYPRKIDKEKLKALKSLGYISDGAPSPYTKEDLFGTGFSSMKGILNSILMYKNLNKIGILRYSDFIRKYEWGQNLSDKYYPKKVITLNNKKYFFLSNDNKDLFQYDKKKGFNLYLSNIEDIAIDSKRNILYFVRNNELKIMEMDGKKRNHELKNIKQSLPCRGVYTDQNNNLFILKKEKILKLDENRKVITHYNIPDINSNLFAVDLEENMFVYGKNEIIKLDKNGSFIRSFGGNEITNGISSIALDNKNNIWVLEKKSPSIIIYNRNGEKITSFIYNKSSNPLPLDLFICHDKIYIIDNWEGILVYSLSETI